MEEVLGDHVLVPEWASPARWSPAVRTAALAVGYVALVGLVLGCVALVWQSPQAHEPAVPAGPEPPPAEIPVPPPPVDPTPAIQTSATLRKTGKKKHGGPKITLPEAHAKPAAMPRTDEMTVWRRLRWILLAFAPSSLMLGVTSYMSTDVAAIPFFWVIPLALYLLSFILVFLRWPIPWTGKAGSPSTTRSSSHTKMFDGLTAPCTMLRRCTASKAANSC